MVTFTAYGRDQYVSEPRRTPNPLGGATDHAEACGYDTGKNILLTGVDYNGKKFQARAKSVVGAVAKFQAARALSRAWHIREDGTRRLLFTR